MLERILKLDGIDAASQIALDRFGHLYLSEEHGNRVMVVRVGH